MSPLEEDFVDKQLALAYAAFTNEPKRQRGYSLYGVDSKEEADELVVYCKKKNWEAIYNYYADVPSYVVSVIPKGWRIRQC